MRTTALLLLLFTSCAFAQSPHQRLSAGWSLYHSQRYTACVDTVAPLVAQGWENADLYLLLGNCAFRRDRLGKALVWYARAYRLDPTREDIRENQLVAHSRILQPIDPVPDLFFVEWWTDLGHQSAARLLVLLGGFVGLTALGIFQLFALSRVPVRRVGLALCVLGSAGSLLFFSAVLARNSWLNDRDEAVVIVAEAAAWEKPTPEVAPSFVVTEGNTLRIRELRGSLCGVRLPDGRECWMRLVDLERI